MRSPVVQIDDAYISYRYARNLVDGHGLVYNVGEYVEGFSNLLWTLLIAGGLTLGLDAETAGHLLGLIGGIAALCFTFFYARIGLGADRAWLAGFAPFVLLCSVPFGMWASAGMETPLFLAAVTAALAASTAQRMGLATAALIVCTLTRPDGVIAAAVVYGFHLLGARHFLNARQRRGAWLGFLLGPPGVYAAFLVGLTGFRLAYYGAALPNTFQAKVGGVPLWLGFNYLTIFLVWGAALLLVPCAVSLVASRRHWRAAAFCLTLCTYVVAVGGDAFPHSRFLLPCLPCLAVMCIDGVASACKKHLRYGLALGLSIPATMAWYSCGSDAAPFVIGLGIAPVLGLLVPGGAWRRGQVVAVCATAAVMAFVAVRKFPIPRLGFPPIVDISSRSEALDEMLLWRSFTDRFMRRSSAWLLREDPPPRLIAAVSIGKLGYFSGLPILDLVGIVDPRIAKSELRVKRAMMIPGHQRTDARYVLSRRPDFIFAFDKGPWKLPCVKELFANPDFQTHYRFDRRVRAYRRVRSERPEP